MATKRRHPRVPWNKGKIVGQKAPLKLREIWAIRVWLQLRSHLRELALFNLAIDSKLRACDRFPTSGLYVWEFERRDRHEGLCIAFLPEEEFAPHIEQGRLMRVLQDWCPPFSGYHLYYPSRRQHSPAFSLVVDALRI